MDRNHDHNMSFEEYLTLNQRLYLAITGEKLSSDLAHLRAKEDWAADAHGADSLCFDGFSKCMFQVGQLMSCSWCGTSRTFLETVHKIIHS